LRGQNQKCVGGFPAPESETIYMQAAASPGAGSVDGPGDRRQEQSPPGFDAQLGGVLHDQVENGCRSEQASLLLRHHHHSVTRVSVEVIQPPQLK
jgi:hypothetical protein